MLIGAVLLVAQLGEHGIRALLSTGEKGSLEAVTGETRGSANHFCEKLAKASPLEILDFVKAPNRVRLTEALLRHADDLDYLQTLISSLGNRNELNPSMNAVCEAFSRRRFSGRFRRTGQTVELDTLLQQETKGVQEKIR